CRRAAVSASLPWRVDVLVSLVPFGASERSDCSSCSSKRLLVVVLSLGIGEPDLARTRIRRSCRDFELVRAERPETPPDGRAAEVVPDAHARLAHRTRPAAGCPAAFRRKILTG